MEIAEADVDMNREEYEEQQEQAAENIRNIFDDAMELDFDDDDVPFQRARGSSCSIFVLRMEGHAKLVANLLQLTDAGKLLPSDPSELHLPQQLPWTSSL